MVTVYSTFLLNILNFLTTKQTSPIDIALDSFWYLSFSCHATVATFSVLSKISFNFHIVCQFVPLNYVGLLKQLCIGFLIGSGLFVVLLHWIVRTYVRRFRDFIFLLNYIILYLTYLHLIRTRYTNFKLSLFYKKFTTYVRRYIFPWMIVFDIYLKKIITVLKNHICNYDWSKVEIHQPERIFFFLVLVHTMLSQ